jgi:hypothetical protein
MGDNHTPATAERDEGKMTMYHHVYIHDGKLPIGKLQFQLSDENGNLVDFDYFGNVGISGNKLRIIAGRDSVHDFTIADRPTPESVEYANGYEKAESQQRKRWPNPDKFSRHFISGWLAGWKEKGR